MSLVCRQSVRLRLQPQRIRDRLCAFLGRGQRVFHICVGLIIGCSLRGASRPVVVGGTSEGRSDVYVVAFLVVV